MTATDEPEQPATRVSVQQFIKWTVYALLLVNWGYYLWEDWQNAQHTLANGGDLLAWTTAFGTSLDEAAWFGLLFLWELETYILSDDADSPFIQRLTLGVRGLCYLFIAHTVFAWSVAFYELKDLQPEPALSDLCSVASQDLSWTYNLHYTQITPQNCDTFTTDSNIYRVDSTAVTDSEGFRVERQLSWIDLQDAITWLLVMFTIELAIWLQERNITGGPVMFVSHAGKALYGLLFLHAAFWAWRGHWLYTWDQVLWIGGFFAIEMNMKDWREEITRLTQGFQTAGDQRQAL